MSRPGAAGGFGPYFMVRKADGAVVGEIGAGLDGATAQVGYGDGLGRAGGVFAEDPRGHDAAAWPTRWTGCWPTPWSGMWPAAG